MSVTHIIYSRLSPFFFIDFWRFIPPLTFFRIFFCFALGFGFTPSAAADTAAAPTLPPVGKITTAEEEEAAEADAEEEEEEAEEDTDALAVAAAVEVHASAPSHDDAVDEPFMAWTLVKSFALRA